MRAAGGCARETGRPAPNCSNARTNSSSPSSSAPWALASRARSPSSRACEVETTGGSRLPEVLNGCLGAIELAVVDRARRSAGAKSSTPRAWAPSPRWVRGSRSPAPGRPQPRRLPPRPATSWPGSHTALHPGRGVSRGRNVRLRLFRVAPVGEDGGEDAMARRLLGAAKIVDGDAQAGPGLDERFVPFARR